jgi:hypothetical protein
VHILVVDKSSADHTDRYDASITRGCLAFMLELFQRRLMLGCPSMRDAKPQASAPGPEKC